MPFDGPISNFITTSGHGEPPIGAATPRREENGPGRSPRGFVVFAFGMVATLAVGVTVIANTPLGLPTPGPTLNDSWEPTLNLK